MTSYTITRQYDKASVTNYGQTLGKDQTLTDMLRRLLNKEAKTRKCTSIKVKEEE